MSNLTNYFNHAELALATYADLWSGMDLGQYEAALKQDGKGMSATHAKKFAAAWTVVEQYEGPAGLSATVFADANGKRYLAVRGTQDIADLWTDITDVTILGTPERQAQYAALKTKVTEWLGNGTLQSGFTVSGHSLGGFLAGALLVDFPTQIEHAYLYNAPGVGGLSASLRLLLGLESDPSLQLGKVSNLRADASLSPIAGLGIAWGTPISIAIENQNPNIVGNHSIVTLTDALAVCDLYIQLQPNIAIEAIGNLLKASSVSQADTLESATRSLYKLFIGNEPSISTGNRESLYVAVYAAIDNPLFKALAGTAKIESLLTSGADALVTLAKTSSDALAYRYALKELNPFAILGADYGLHNPNGELNLYNKETGEGQLTDQYLADRAQFLAGVLEANLADTGSGKNLRVDTYRNDPIYFKDEANGLSLQQINPVTGESTGPQYRFGGNGNDTLWGKDTNDHLYGGAGLDTLDGGKGDDYLEGNAGSDAITGGKGNDTLLGGQGLDTYIFTSGDGWDWIEDSDGQGALYYDDIQLTGGEAVGDTGMVWQKTLNKGSADEKTFTYLLTDWTEGGQTFKRLSIQGPDGGMLVKGWSAGQLGINLEGATPPPPVDKNLIYTLKDAPPYYTEGTAGDDKIIGGDWVDTIYAGGGNDILIDGGIAFDYLDGGTGDDRLEMSGGRDVGRGRDGNDTLVARNLDGGPIADAVFLDGGADDDVLNGSNGNDLLAGGRGKDTLLGGEGGDYMVGDMEIRVAGGDWSWTPPDAQGHYGGAHWSLDPNAGTMVPSLTEAGYYQAETADIGEDDLLDGGGGDDYMHGGAGDDTLIGGSGKDCLRGGKGDDYLDGGDQDDDIFGNAGGDLLAGGNGNDHLSGDDSYDPGQHGNDTLDGGTGNDTLWGQGGDDTLYGGDGNDQLQGDANESDLAGVNHGKDILYGGAGNDLLIGQGRNDFLYGGVGDDELQGDALSSVLSGQFHGDDILDGGIGNDALMGEGGNDTLFGGADDDILYGDAGNGDALVASYEGNDTLDGGSGNDTLWGGGGNDSLIGGTGRDYLAGGEGDDSYQIGAGEAPIVNGMVESINDTAGANRLKLDVAPSALSVYRQGGDLTLYWSNDSQGLLVQGGLSGSVKDYTLGDKKLTWIELMNNYLQDSLNASSSTSGATMVGGALDDSLQASGGGGSFYGGLGNDSMNGNGGNNTYVYNLGDGQDRIADLGSKVDGNGTPTPNTLQFGSGITAAMLALESGNNANILKIRIDENQSIEIAGFNPSDALSIHPIDRFAFADGSTLTYEELLLSRPVNVIGTDASEQMNGTNLADRLFGGKGSDDYVIREIGDVAVEMPNEGYDSVHVEHSYALGDNIEALYLDGSAAVDGSGNELNNYIADNTGNNRLVGNEGNDTLRGNGGTLWRQAA